MPESGVCLSTQQHGVNEHELQAGPATQRECLGVVKCREEPPLGQLGVGHLCGGISIVIMVSSQRIPPVLQGGCCEHVLQGTQQERRKVGSTWTRPVHAVVSKYLKRFLEPWVVYVLDSIVVKVVS